MKPPVGTPINFTHPMAKDLIFFCMMDRAGNQIDLVNGKEGIISDSGGGATVELVATNRGLAQDFEMVQGQHKGFDFGDTGGFGIYEPNALTIVAKIRPDNGFEVDSGWSRVISKRNAVGGDDNYALGFSNASTFFIRVNTVSAQITASGSVGDQECDVALIAGPNASAIGYLWNLTKGESYTASMAGASINGSTGNLCIGHRQDEARGWDGIIHYVAIWNKQKTEAFVEAFRRNPWQIFGSQRILIPMTAAAVVEELGPETTVFITDVNTTESWDDGDTGLIITGSGFA